MELILVVVGAIVVTAIAHRRGLEPALIIVVIGIAASFLPGFEAPELDSGILLTVVLPPLLYSAALAFSFPTFLRNIKPILGLGVGLVVVTATRRRRLPRRHLLTQDRRCPTTQRSLDLGV